MPSEPSVAVAVNVQTAEASAATATEDGESRTSETGEEALLLICNEKVSDSVPVLNTRTSMVDSTSGSITEGPLGPWRTKAISRSTSNEKSRTNETAESEASVAVIRREQTSPTFAVEPTSTWKGRSSFASTSIVDAYDKSAAVHGPESTVNA